MSNPVILDDGLSRAVIEYIDDRLETMQTAPGSWGSTESLELQALLLLELRTFILRRRAYERNPFEARNLYIKFVRDHFPGSPASLMNDAAGERSDLIVPKLIGELRRSFIERLPPESEEFMTKLPPNYPDDLRSKAERVLNNFGRSEYERGFNDALKVLDSFRAQLTARPVRSQAEHLKTLDVMIAKARERLAKGE